MDKFDKSREHLIPQPLRDTVENYIKATNQNQRDVLVQRLEAIRDFCNAWIEHHKNFGVIVPIKRKK